MKLIIGLGNPGARYAKTRHNVGRQLVETLARKFRASWRKGGGLKARWAEVKSEEISFLLALPELFMNESGKTVHALVTHFGIDFRNDLLIVADDAALPFGRLRLRAKGSDGGHRGLRSIEEALGSREYARLRIGIGPSAPTEALLEKYVLSPFTKQEGERWKELLEHGLRSCELWLSGPIEKAMDQTNPPSLP